MKNIILTAILISVGNFSNGQISKIDSLILQLKNSQVGLGGDYGGPNIYLAGEPSLSLYKIGKPATEKLVSVLDDTTRGIIAHCILSWIWEFSNRPETILLEEDTIVIYTYNKLHFFQKPGRIYTNKGDLVWNKFQWRSYLKVKRY